MTKNSALSALTNKTRSLVNKQDIIEEESSDLDYEQDSPTRKAGPTPAKFGEGLLQMRETGKWNRNDSL